MTLPIHGVFLRFLMFVRRNVPAMLIWNSPKYPSAEGLPHARPFADLHAGGPVTEHFTLFTHLAGDGAEDTAP